VVSDIFLLGAIVGRHLSPFWATVTTNCPLYATGRFSCLSCLFYL